MFWFILGQFTQGELDVVLTKIENKKAVGFDEIPSEVWKTRKFDDLLLRYCNAVYSHNTIEGWTKGCILPFTKKSDLGIAKNNRAITLISIAGKIYNAQLLNCIGPEIEKILKKKQNGFQRNRSTTLQILRIRRILEGVRIKKPPGDTYRSYGSQTYPIKCNFFQAVPLLLYWMHYMDAD